MQITDKAIQSVIFDLDDTLFPEWRYVRSGYRAVSSHLSERMRRSERFEQFLWDRFSRQLRSGAFDALNEEFRLGLNKRQIGKLVEIYREHCPDIVPFAGVADMLGRLGRSYRLGLISDGYLPAQKLKLDALKLGRFFEAIVFTEEMGRDCWKPSPAGFERMAEMLGTPHESCAYVADNPSKDFLAPNQLGWLTVQYRFPGQIHADNVGPQGSQAQRVVRLPGELYEALLRQ